jgi:hypothetical protein
MTRITRQQVAIIGSVLIVLVAGSLFYFLILPLSEREAAAQQKYETQHAIAVQRPQAEEDLRKAKQEVAQAEAKWRRYERQYMPDINLSDLIRAMQQRWNEQSLVLGPKVVRFARADRRVRIATMGVSVPAPPADPNAVNQQFFSLPLGAISVVGTFRNVLSHVERWNNFDRLVLVDGLTLAGNSPRLVGQYTLTCYIFTKGAPGPAIPTAGGAGGAGAGGFPGGPPGGFPGGPPGGFPGGGPPGAPPGGAGSLDAPM